MSYWQSIFISLFGIIAFLTFIQSLFKCQTHEGRVGKPYRICELYGSFVWADHVVFGLFWTVMAFVALLLQDWIFFLLTISLFWFIRSIGETVYWILQQFLPRKGNEPEKYWINKIVTGEGVWFIHQIIWQCVSVITLLTSIYLTFLWLSNF